MKLKTTLFSLGLALSIAGTLVAGPLERMAARVGKVIEAKQKGLVGEQRDGLLGVIPAGNAEAQSLAAEENADRMEVYRQRAKDQSYKVENFQRVMGDEKIQKAQPGTYVQDAAGNWVKK